MAPSTAAVEEPQAGVTRRTSWLRPDDEHLVLMVPGYVQHMRRHTQEYRRGPFDPASVDGLRPNESASC